MSDFLDLQGAKDLNTDAIHIGAVANSKDPVTGAAIDTHTNRSGGTDYTMRGFWNALGPVVMPWTSVTGGTLTQPNQAFLNQADGNYYSWSGVYPVGGYVVAPGTDPTAVVGYVPRTDVVLRVQLTGENGAYLSFSQISTAYGVPFGSIHKFDATASYNTTDHVFYENALWRPYADGTNQPSVTYDYFYKVPKRGERWSPELFGCSGLGEASPDTVYFAKMLATLPAKSTVWLTPGAEYYNAAPNGMADMWVVNKELKFIGFGAKISRRPSRAGENNFSAIKLAITASFTKFIGDIEISGNEPEYNLVNSSGVDISTIPYSRALSSSHCIHIEAAKDVTLDGLYLHHSNFCLWAYGADRLVAKIRVHKSGQTYPVTGADLQLGAGIKLTSCNDFEVHVTARYCTNAGLEIEPDNYNGVVSVVGAYNYQSDLTITNSQDIIYDVVGHDSRYGVQLSTGAQNITGRSNHTNCSVAAVNVWPLAATVIDNINLDINAHDCAGYGLYHYAQYANIENFNYKINVINCNTSNEGVIIRGAGTGFLTGNIKGSNVGLSPQATTNLQVHDMDLTGNTTSYYAIINAVFGMNAVRTGQGLLNMLPSSDTRVYNVKQSTTTGVYQFTNITDYVVRATNISVPNLPTSGAFSGQLYYDPADGNRVKFKV